MRAGRAGGCVGHSPIVVEFCYGTIKTTHEIIGLLGVHEFYRSRIRMLLVLLPYRYADYGSVDHHHAIVPSYFNNQPFIIRTTTSSNSITLTGETLCRQRR